MIGETFIEQGIDILLFETFPELETILPAIAYLKETHDCTILVHFSVNQFGLCATVCLCLSLGVFSTPLYMDIHQNSMVCRHKSQMASATPVLPNKTRKTSYFL